MTELQTEPAVLKLLEYGKKKKTLSYDEVNDFLPEEIVNSEKIEEVFTILEQHKIVLKEDGLDLGMDDEDEDESEHEPEPEPEPEPAEEALQKPKKKKKIVTNQKDASIDDPIRLYLREIGKENLLTAEEEVILSKQMEDGENIIKKL